MVLKILFTYVWCIRNGLDRDFISVQSVSLLFQQILKSFLLLIKYIIDIRKAIIVCHERITAHPVSHFPMQRKRDALTAINVLSHLVDSDLHDFFEMVCHPSQKATERIRLFSFTSDNFHSYSLRIMSKHFLHKKPIFSHKVNMKWCQFQWL